MNTSYLDTALNKFGEVTESPTIFFRGDNQLSNNIKSNIKEVYDFTKKEIQSHSTKSLLKLFVTNVDSEQIWQQLEIQNKEVITTSINNLSVMLVGKDKLLFNDLNNQIYDSKNVTGSKNENPSIHLENSKDNSEIKEATNFICDTYNSAGELASNYGGCDKKKTGYSIVDDQFFKLSEMESFLKKEERELADYDDYYESNESGDEGSINFFEENNETREEQENEAKIARFKDYFVAKDKSERTLNTNNLLEEMICSTDRESNDAIKTNLKLRQERLKKKICKFEEQAISEKSWQLKGEITAESRPQNSLLEEVVGLDLISKPAPVITEKTSLQLEDIIRQRIKDKVFDNVERRTKPMETPLEYKKKLVLDQEKSKQSLAKIYEHEYVEQKAALDLEHSEKEEQVPELHKELKTLIINVFAKLDALSNFHFTSKPTVPELKIVSHLPALNIEEVAPVTASDASLLAPEEIKNKLVGYTIGKGERTSSDKKRERRKKKLKQKIHKQIKLKNENLKNAITGGLQKSML